MIRTEDILTSESGKRMLGYVSPVYDKSRIMLAIFEAIGREIDGLEFAITDIQNQFFPQTATWGLKYWEQQLGLPVNETLPVEIRRANVISRLATKYPMTRNRMERIINGYVQSQTAKVVEYFSEYSFAAILPIDEAVNYIEMGKAVYDAKPAHLAFIASPQTRETIIISDRVTTNMRRYHKVHELRVGMPLMKYQQEVVL